MMEVTTIAFLVIALAAVTIEAGNSASILPANFWPSINNDLTKLEWKVVKNKKEFEKALETDAHMLEIVVNGTNTHDIFGLKDGFNVAKVFEKVTKHNEKNKNRKGLKLVFETTNSYLKLEHPLMDLASMIEFPLFLHADVVQGPVTGAVPSINGTDFINRMQNSVPKCIISLGWTTSYEKNTPINLLKYTPWQIYDMKKLVNNFTKNNAVTFAVRASIVLNNLDYNSNLMNDLLSSNNVKNHNATLTIVANDSDGKVNATALNSFKNTIPKEKVYDATPKVVTPKPGKGGSNSGTAFSISTLVFSFCMYVVLVCKI